MATRRSRKRGVILTELGLNRLLEAKEEDEFQKNRGNRYTREQLAEITGLSEDTCNRILDNEIPVDKTSLKKFFKSFNLTLETKKEKPSDYYYPDDLPPLLIENELPDGLVPLTSRFYVERSPIEANCYKNIMQPGALLRLKAPRRTGKTSLMTRILDNASKKKEKSVFIGFSSFDNARLQDLDSFLKTFCTRVEKNLALDKHLEEYWDDMFGSKMSCTSYFEEYLLASLNDCESLVLGLDDVDYLFQYPNVADDFFALLRSWHEEAKNKAIWQKLRLIVAHSTEVYIPLNINHSPFNVGIPVELPDFTPLQVQDLSKRYDLNWSLSEVEELMALVKGNPYLIRWALYHIEQEDVTLEELLEEPLMSANSIYADHLRRQLFNLQQKPPELIRAYAKVVMADHPIDLDLIQAFKLESLGLVTLIHNQATPSCPLYGRYFWQYFQENPL